MFGCQLWKGEEAEAIQTVVHAYKDVTVLLNDVCRIVHWQLPSCNVNAVPHDPASSMYPDNDGDIAAILGTGRTENVEVQTILAANEDTISHT